MTSSPKSSPPKDSPCERILFVTGRLAESSLRRVLLSLSANVGFEYEIAVMKITVAALIHAEWLIKKLAPPENFSPTFDRVIVPGWCQGDLSLLTQRYNVPFERGPKNVFNLPEFFGDKSREPINFDQYEIDILGEINHAPQFSDAAILQLANNYRDSGANLIDVGCVPGQRWDRVGEITQQLCDAGHRVSIDSFDRVEVEAAVNAGAELVLSCNSTNREWAADLNAELVVIPDEPDNFASLEETVDFLEQRQTRFRIDPILEPIGFGFAASLNRYFEARRRWPDAEMMMGIGNLTELTEVDSAGINLLLASVCQELKIHSVLTTEVINWSRTAIREFDIARRMVSHSLRQQVIPKRLGLGLALLRDSRLNRPTRNDIDELAGEITDPNFRILLDEQQIHIFNRDGHWHGNDAYELFDQLMIDSKAADKARAAQFHRDPATQKSPRTVDPSHAFYLGYELCKAVTALTLGKQYTQDEPLQWGFLTREEISAHDRRKEKGTNTKNS